MNAPIHNINFAEEVKKASTLTQKTSASIRDIIEGFQKFNTLESDLAMYPTYAENFADFSERAKHFPESAWVQAIDNVLKQYNNISTYESGEFGPRDEPLFTKDFLDMCKSLAVIQNDIYTDYDGLALVITKHFDIPEAEERILGHIQREQSQSLAA